MSSAASSDERPGSTPANADQRLLKGPPSAAILLAAGRSQRMGQPKGLLKLGSKNLLLHQVDHLLSAGLHPVIVVSWAPEYTRELSSRGVVLVPLSAPSRSPFESLQLGLAHVPDGRGCVVVPLDAPLINSVPWSTLIGGARRAARLSCNGTPAHPVWLSADLQVELLGLDPADGRLDHVLRDLPSVLDVPVDDPRVLCNLNSPQDLEAFRTS